MIFEILYNNDIKSMLLMKVSVVPARLMLLGGMFNFWNLLRLIQNLISFMDSKTKIGYLYSL